MSFKIIRRSPLLRGVAEGVGFEPTELSFNGFQDRRLKPLGHPSLQSVFYICLVDRFCQAIPCTDECEIYRNLSGGII